MVVDFSLYVTNPPSSGLWVIVTQPSSGFVVDAALEPYGGPSAVFGLTFKSPAQLGSGLINGSVTFKSATTSNARIRCRGVPSSNP